MQDILFTCGFTVINAAVSTVQEFTAPPGNDSITTGDDLSTAEEQLTREDFIRCSEPPAIDKQNGLEYSQPDQWWLPGTIVTYSCAEPYKIYGNPNRTCLPDGTWSGLEPVCASKFILYSDGKLFHCFCPVLVTGLVISHGGKDVTRCQVDGGTRGVSLNCRMEPSFPSRAVDLATWKTVRQEELPHGARERWTNDETEFQLFFDRISMQDNYSDTYICQVSNFKQEVYLEVVNTDPPPAPPKVLPLLKRSNSSYSTLRCTVVGCTVTITWYRNNELFEGGHAETLTTPSMAISDLTVERTPENIGRYHCRGENKGGAVTSKPLNITGRLY